MSRIGITREDFPKVQVLLADLKECSRTQNLEKGKDIHALAVESGSSADIYVASALINMYAKCGSMIDAQRVFDNVNHQNVVCWTAMILGYAENGQGLVSLELFRLMTQKNLVPDSVTFVAVIKACTSLVLKRSISSEECRDWGISIHNLATENGNLNIYVQNILIDMYVKCDQLVDARHIFDSIKHPDAISWNALMMGYAGNGQALTTLSLFMRMTSKGIRPDSVTFVAAFRAYTLLSVEGVDCEGRGKAMHNLATENMCADNYVLNTLIDMYANFRSMVYARLVFDSIEYPNVVSWNVLILGYAESGEGLTSLDFVSKIKLEGLAPDSVTFVASLKACSSLAVKGTIDVECRDWGRIIHNLAVEYGFHSDIYVQSALIDMYSKCGSMLDAGQTFDSLEKPDIVSCNALILGYADNGQSLTALEVYTRMRSKGLAADSFTFSGALKACTLLGALDVGRTIHSEIDRGNHLDLVLVDCLVDFYAKCGSLLEAESVFNLHGNKRNNITWNALLAGLSSCGYSESVFKRFEEMQDTGFQPDSVTFLCILSCCRHAGLVEKGEKYFKDMTTKYGILPTIEHYTCMINMFGRADKLDDAMALLQSMTCSPDKVTWMAVLDTCRKWRNVEIGRLAFQSLSTFNENDAAGYVLMGQIYESRGMLQEQEMVMSMRKNVLTCP